MFERVVIINLKRRPDRLQKLQAHLSSIQWPFLEPVIFSAIDASKLPVPNGWHQGGGAWGCMQSHRQVIEQALMDGINSVLVLEDDVYFVDGFAEKAAAFLKNVPDDWEQLMLGGQYVSRDGSLHRQVVTPGVELVSGCERTHCYAVRGQFMRDLYAKWCASMGHCDHVMGPFQKGRRVYAPSEFLAGQSEGKSDISHGENCASLWVEPPKDWPVTLFVGTPEQAAEYRKRESKHSGHNLKDEIDIGLADILSKPKGEQVQRLQAWVKMIEWEGRSKTPERQCMIYGVPEKLCRSAIGDRLVIVKKKCGGGCKGAKMAGNALKAAGRVVGAILTGKDVKVSVEQRDARLAVCVACNQFEKATSKLPARCQDCGCFVKAKAFLATESCPRGKWPGETLAPKVFWHVAAMPGAWTIIEQQAKILKESGLVVVDVTFLGSPLNLVRFQELCAEQGLSARVLRSDANFKHYETFAMMAMEEWAKEGNGPVLYFHTKGASVPKHEGKQRWRKLMEDEVIRNWRANVALLDSKNIIGCNWRNFGGHPHFSGNFWISTAEYIRTLPSFVRWHHANRLERFSCESWIGQGQRKSILSLAHRDVDYCAKRYFG